jgi:predicted permease membrane protein
LIITGQCWTKVQYPRDEVLTNVSLFAWMGFAVSWIILTLQRYPEIAIFRTLAIGFAIGRIKLGKFSLGNVSGVLIAGVLIGQINITILPHLK